MNGGRRGAGVFTKPPLSSPQLVELMVQRGLEVADEEAAAETLFHIGYYRLQPYARGFEMPGSGHRFRPGTTFEELIDRYDFDRNLRLLTLDALARIEVAYRAALSEVMSQLDGDTHWYTRASLFENASDFKVLLGNVEQAVEQPHPALDPYLARFRSPELPPSWLMVEVLSLGQLVRAYRNLKRAKHRDAVARALGLTDPVLQSWLDCFVRVRNICAHHERLWDAHLPSYPTVPPDDVPWPRPWSDAVGATFHAVAAAIGSLMLEVAAGDGWSARLRQLLSGRPEAVQMGFKPGWESNEFWR